MPGENMTADPLARLRAALNPGGWLVCEEFDSESLPPDPTVNAGEVLLRTQIAMGRLMADRGFDRRFGRRLFAHLRNQGLADVDADPRYLACFASTRSEIVVPIFDGGAVVGEIDIDGSDPDAFDDTDARFLEEVAALIAPLRPRA